MEVFVVLNGEKKGPLTLYQLREMLRDGAADGSTIGWMRGQPGWVPLRELPPALSILQEMEQERLDAELAKRARPPVPPPPDISYRRLPSHALARYGARMIDVLVAHLVLLTLLSIPEVPKGFPEMDDPQQAMAYLQRALLGDIPKEHVAYSRTLALIQLGGLAGFWMLEAALLTLFGTTPGKFLFRLRVEAGPGARPRFFQALGRSLLVFWLGLGGRIPVLEWVASLVSFVRLQNRGTTFWDQWMGTVVRQEAVSRKRVLAIGLVFLAILGVAFLLPAG